MLSTNQIALFSVTRNAETLGLTHECMLLRSYYTNVIHINL